MPTAHSFSWLELTCPCGPQDSTQSHPPSTCLRVRAPTKHRFGPFSPCAAPQAAHTGHVQGCSDFHQHWIRPQCNSKPTRKQQPVPPLGTHAKAEEGQVLPVVESHLQQSEVRLCQENVFPLLFCCSFITVPAHSSWFP